MNTLTQPALAGMVHVRERSVKIRMTSSRRNPAAKTMVQSSSEIKYVAPFCVRNVMPKITSASTVYNIHLEKNPGEATEWDVEDVVFSRRMATKATTTPNTCSPRILSLNRNGAKSTGIRGAMLVIGKTSEAGPLLPSALYNMTFPSPAVTPVASASRTPFPRWLYFFRFLEKSNNRAKGTRPALESICTIDPERSWLANGDKR